jgi:hypothetical protein
LRYFPVVGNLHGMIWTWEFGEPDVEWLKRANDAVEEMRLKPQADQVAKDGLQVGMVNFTLYILYRT